MVYKRNTFLLSILVFSVVFHPFVAAQQANLLLLAVKRVVSSKRHVQSTTRFSDQTMLVASYTDAQTEDQKEQQRLQALIEQQRRAQEPPQQVVTQQEVIVGGTAHLTVDTTQQESEVQKKQTLLEQVQSFSCDAHRFSRENNRQYEQDLPQRIENKSDGMTFIGQNIVPGFCPHPPGVQKLCKSLSVEEWQLITNQKTSSEVLNAFQFFQYKNFRKMVREAEQFPGWVSGQYLLMQSNKAHDDELRNIPNNARDYLYEEGQAAYTKLETARIKEGLKGNKLSLLNRTQTDDIAKKLQEQNALLTRNGGTFTHEVEDNKVLIETLRLTHDVHKKNEDVTYVDYHSQAQKELGSNALQELTKLGVTKADLMLAGTSEQHLIYKGLFFNHGYEKIAALALSPNIHPDDRKMVNDSLGKAAWQARLGIQAVRSGDLDGAQKCFSAMNHCIEYAQRIESGVLKYHDVYSDSNTEPLQRWYLERREATSSTSDPNFKYSPCHNGCVEGCQDKDRHIYLQENNEMGRRHRTAADTLGELRKGNHTITHLIYTLPKGAQQALRNAGIPIAPFEQRVGNVHDQEIQKQACTLAVRATSLNDEHAIQRAASVEAALDGLDELQRGNPHRAMELINAGHELTYMENNAVSGPQHRISHEAGLRYAAKAVELGCDFGVGFGKGVVLGALRTVNLAAHPTELLKEIGHALGAVGSLSAALVQNAAEMAYVHLPFVSEESKKEVAERILKRQEGYIDVIEKVVAHLHTMTAEDAGVLLGNFAVDTMTGKALAGTATNLLRRTKGLLEVVKKSEKVSYATDFLSQRYHNLVRKMEDARERIKKGLAIEPPQPMAAGVPGEAGLSLMEAEKVVEGGGKVASASSYVMEKFVSAAKTTEELLAKYCKEITQIIDGCTDKCRAIGLPVPDIKTFQHILGSHMKDGYRSLYRDGTFRSVFNAGEDWIKLGLEAWEKGTFVEPGVKVHDFGRIIGLTKDGVPTSTMKIVTGGARWVTSYPIDKMLGV